MGSSPSSLLASVLVALALAGALAGCGGGTTGAPIAAQATTAATPAVPAAPAATAPRTAAATRAAPPPQATPPPATGAHAARPATATTATPATHPHAAPPSAPRPAPAPAAQPRPRTVSIDELADLTLTQRASPAHYFQAGTVTGTYAGTMAVEARITSQGVLVRFTAALPGGTIAGHALAVAILDSTTWPGLRGTGEIDSGTGRFAGVHGRGLRLTGRARPDVSHARVRLTGTVSF